MIFSEMVSTLRSSVGNPSSGDVTDDVLKGHLNDCYKEIGDKYRFFKGRKLCTFHTVSGTENYTLPITTTDLIRLYDTTNSQPLTLISDSEAQIKRASYTNLDKPLWYTHYRDWIRFMPIPDGEYTIEVYYKYAFSTLAGDTDEPVIPEAWHTGIVRLARYNYFEFTVGDVAKATAAMNAFNFWVSTKPNELEEELRHVERGVYIPELDNGQSERLDFDHAP